MKFIEQRKERLNALTRIRPEYAEVFDFYGRLLTFLEEERLDCITVEASSESPGAERLESGMPLLGHIHLQVDARETLAFLDRLIDFLGERGKEGQEDLQQLKRFIKTEDPDIGRLLGACLERNRRPLAETAEKAGVSAPLLEYLLDTTLSFVLQRARERGLDVPSVDWDRGYCPLCGGSPAMGELTGEEGRLVLHCATCAQAWEAPRLQCTSCGTREEDALKYFTAEGETGYRVNTCGKCGSYLKILDSRVVGSDLPLDVEDLSTLHLDHLAQQEGFSRTKQDSDYLRARKDHH